MVNSISGAGSKDISNLFTSQVDNPTSALGKTEFLEMLVTKLKYQDPLKPLTDESFIADLAQFSSLEQMQNLNTSFSSQASTMEALNKNLISLILMQNTTQAASLIGKSVTLEVPQADGTKYNVEGVVSIVRFVDGMPKIVVGGNEYDLGYVKEIKA